MAAVFGLLNMPDAMPTTNSHSVLCHAALWIPYYEEVGFLAAPPTHAKGRHRTYGDHDVRRVQELIRLRDLLGVSLDELKSLVEAEEARAVLRERWHDTASPADRRAILEQSLGHLTAQLALVRSRREALDRLEAELAAKLERVCALLAEPEGA